MAKSPQPPKKESRAHPRFEIFASVEIRHGEDTLVLPARNVSLGGLYLQASKSDLTRIKAGAFRPLRASEIAVSNSSILRGLEK